MSSRAPLSVDVVINNHNYGRFLGAAIDSALRQTHDRVAVTVVDDGSTDHSRDVIARYGSRIRPVLKSNGGQASALNAGFARTAAEIVIFLDADDVLVPDLAAGVAEAFAAHPEAAKVQYRMAVIDEIGRRTGEIKPLDRYPLPSGDLRRAVLTFPFDLPSMATSGNAFPRRVLERLLPAPEQEYRLLADWYLVHLAPLFGDVVTLDQVGACYRVHSANRYEQRHPVLDLEHVHQSVVHAAATRAHLEHAADALDLTRHAGPILSVSDLANRLISLRLDRDAHPLPDDGVARLLVSAVRASGRRFDVRWPTKLLFVCWFIAMTAAPRRLAVHVGELFLFPQRRWPNGALTGNARSPRGSRGREAVRRRGRRARPRHERHGPSGWPADR
jgi:Glycosyl transferase family 2